MHTFLLAVLTLMLMQLSCGSAFIDCRTACKRCREGYETMDVLEVYCSMCKECRDRRRERMGKGFVTEPIKHELYATTTPKQLEVREIIPLGAAPSSIHRRPPKKLAARHAPGEILEAWPEGCPTPPICEEEVELLTHAHVTTTSISFTASMTTTTTTTTTTLPPVTCPPIKSCRPKTSLTPQTSVCVPCMPMCGTPCSPYSPLPQHIKIDISHRNKESIEADINSENVLKYKQSTGEWLENTVPSQGTTQMQKKPWDASPVVLEESTPAQNIFNENLLHNVLYNGNLHYTGVNDKGTTYSGDLNYNGNLNYQDKQKQQQKGGDDYYVMYIGVPKPLMKGGKAVTALDLKQLLKL